MDWGYKGWTLLGVSAWGKSISQSKWHFHSDCGWLSQMELHSEIAQWSVYFIFDVQIDAVAELHSLIEMKELLPSCLSLSGFAFNLTSCFDFSFLVLFLQVHASQTTVKFNSVFPCRNFWGSERNKKTWGGGIFARFYIVCVYQIHARERKRCLLEVLVWLHLLQHLWLSKSFLPLSLPFITIPWTHISPRFDLNALFFTLPSW